MTVKFNDITQRMLEKYEEELFDVQHKRISGGAVRFLVANVQAAFDAGWIQEPFNDFADDSWKDRPPSAKQTEQLKDIVVAVDAKYEEFTVISPSG